MLNQTDYKKAMDILLKFDWFNWMEKETEDPWEFRDEFEAQESAAYIDLRFDHGGRIYRKSPIGLLERHFGTAGALSLTTDLLDPNPGDGYDEFDAEEILERFWYELAETYNKQRKAS
jgi:hypothetical protein